MSIIQHVRTPGERLNMHAIACADLPSCQRNALGKTVLRYSRSTSPPQPSTTLGSVLTRHAATPAQGKLCLMSFLTG